MCEYKFQEGCRNRNQFWVQSIPTQHNIQCCGNHLTACIKDTIEKANAVKLDLNTESPYAKPRRHETHYGCPANNYATITVKVKSERRDKKGWPIWI